LEGSGGSLIQGLKSNKVKVNGKDKVQPGIFNEGPEVE
jgi:hypothetical protein